MKRKYDSENKVVVESSFGNWSARVTHTSTEYKWRFDVSYEIVAFRGTGECPEDTIVLQGRSGSYDLFTKTDNSIRPAVCQKPPIDVDITWLFRNVTPTQETDDAPSTCSLPEATLIPTFRIDRAHAKCFTPRRNNNVNEAIHFFDVVHHWCTDIHQYFSNDIFPIQEDYQRAHSVDLDTPSIHANGLFVPILPIFIEETPVRSGGEVVVAQAEVTGGGEGEEKTSGLISSGAELVEEQVQSSLSLDVAGVRISYVPDMSVVNSLLQEEQRVLHERFTVMDETFPPASKNDTLITAAEGRLLVSVLHTTQNCQQYVDAVGYIEDLLRQQLVAAIGKEVQPSDFASYMRYHNQKLFHAQYQPKAFCYAVRRSVEHAPEGVLSMEETVVPGAIAEPIYTLANQRPVDIAQCMNFTLNAATTVNFTGDVYLHAYMRHAFHQSQAAAACLSLRAEARQFSSFIVMIGRISSASTFDPKYAMIVQNKDDLRIPLDLETIPSAKEFKDAISSLSPEQQRFAKAFRGMQLESTLFGVLVIQIKPQLEKVLNLPPDSLTKEIALTQDLMELFIKYQIPSDLLSWAGSGGDASVSEKLCQVKGHVAAIQGMISASKEKELKEKRQESLNRRYEADDGLLLMENSACVSDLLDLDMNMAQPATNTTKMKKKGGGIPLFGSKSRNAPSPAPQLREGPARGVREKSTQNKKASSSSMTAPSSSPVGGSATSSPAPAPSSDSMTSSIRPPQGDGDKYEEEGAGDGMSGLFDCTKVPQEIDSKFEAIDKEGSVRPTIINPGNIWSKRFQKSLLDEPHTVSVDADAQKKEKGAAYDLLDALTKSGGLLLEHSQLHVVIAATHCFDKNLLDTIVENNVNPIEKVEMSTLVMASTIHRETLQNLVRTEYVERVLEFSPGLLQIENS